VSDEPQVVQKTGTVHGCSLGRHHEDQDVIGVIYNDGALQLKQGIYGGWVTAAGNVKQLAIGGSSGDPIVGAVYNDGTLQLKRGIYGGWVTAAGNVRSVAIR
jgi:hypothetical protein